MLLDANDLEKEEVTTPAVEEEAPWDDELFEDDDDTDVDKEPEPPANVKPSVYTRLEQARLALKICEEEIKVAKLLARYENARIAWAAADEKLQAMKDGGPNLPKPPVAVTDSTTDQSWRDVTLEALGLSPGICATLREKNGFMLLGDLADYSESNGNFAGLVGVGQAKADKIAAACDKYWAEHNLPQ